MFVEIDTLPISTLSKLWSDNSSLLSILPVNPFKLLMEDWYLGVKIFQNDPTVLEFGIMEQRDGGFPRDDYSFVNNLYSNFICFSLSRNNFCQTDPYYN